MPDTVDDWDPLLRSLTDEELEQYGRLARDQLRREEQWKFVQLGLVVAAIVLALWTLRQMYTVGVGQTQLYALGISAIMGYWPYRTAKSKKLWQQHCDAVLGEKARRATATA